MRRHPQRLAAYTRTKHLIRFLDLAARVPLPAVDRDVAARLGLRGGDVRAFLQSVRVLGLVDVVGRPMERLARARVEATRPAALWEALHEAYPELFEALGERPAADQVREYFRREYRLSEQTAAPAAKLVLDLLSLSRTAASGVGSQKPAAGQRTGDPSSPPLVSPWSVAGVRGGESAGLPADPPLAALTFLTQSLRIEITAEWDAARINLVFDRLERLIARILSEEAISD